MISGIDFPDDYWHTFVYVNFGWLSCGKCEREPDLGWAWNGISTTGEAGVAEFTKRAVEHLKTDGWVMDDYLYCPECASSLHAACR
jgi:hypothetical protein